MDVQVAKVEKVDGHSSLKPMFMQAAKVESPTPERSGRQSKSILWKSRLLGGDSSSNLQKGRHDKDHSGKATRQFVGHITYSDVQCIESPWTIHHYVMRPTNYVDAYHF